MSRGLTMLPNAVQNQRSGIAECRSTWRRSGRGTRRCRCTIQGAVPGAAEPRRLEPAEIDSRWRAHA